MSYQTLRKLCLAVGLAIGLAAPSANANDGASDGETAARPHCETRKRSAQ